MQEKLLSNNLQEDIINALAIYSPMPMSAEQYFDCFGEHDELQMVINIEALIERQLICRKAIHIYDGEKFIHLRGLKLALQSNNIEN